MADAVLDRLIGGGDGDEGGERERYLGRLASLNVARIAAEPQVLAKEYGSHDCSSTPRSLCRSLSVCLSLSLSFFLSLSRALSQVFAGWPPFVSVPPSLSALGHVDPCPCGLQWPDQRGVVLVGAGTRR